MCDTPNEDAHVEEEKNVPVRGFACFRKLAKENETKWESEQYHLKLTGKLRNLIAHSVNLFLGIPDTISRCHLHIKTQNCGSLCVYTNAEPFHPRLRERFPRGSSVYTIVYAGAGPCTVSICGGPISRHRDIDLYKSLPVELGEDIVVKSYRRVSYDRSCPVADHSLCGVSPKPRRWRHAMFLFYFWLLKSCRTCCHLWNIFVEK